MRRQHFESSSALSFPFHSLYYPPFRLSSRLWHLFDTEDTPGAKNSLFVSHPLHWDKGSWKGVKGVKVSPHQSGRYCQQVACSHSSANAGPPNDCALTTLYQSNTVLVTLQATCRTSEGKRQTDWLHSLSLGHCPILSALSSFPSLPFLTALACRRGLRPASHFLINNTDALWNGRIVGGGGVKCAGDERSGGKTEQRGGMSTGDWRGHVVKSEREGKKWRVELMCTAARSAEYVMWSQRRWSQSWVGALGELLASVFFSIKPPAATKLPPLTRNCARNANNT